MSCVPPVVCGGPQRGAEVRVWTASGLYGGILRWCALAPLCPVVVSVKKCGYSSKEGAVLDDSRSSGPHSTDMAIGNEDH